MADFELYVGTARRWFRDKRTQVGFNRFIADFAMRSNWLAEWIEESATNRYRWDLLNRLAQDNLGLGETLPDELAAWVRDVLADQCVERGQKKRRPRPRKGPREAVRDANICHAVYSLIAEFAELHPTRRPNVAKGPLCSAAGGSACDAAGIAYEKEGGETLAYKSVENIWNSRPPYIVPPHRDKKTGP